MKKILIVFMMILVLTGCGKKEESVNKKNDNDDRRTSFVDGLGVTNDKKVVINYLNGNKENCYYLFYITGTRYTLKQFTLHDNKESYTNYVNKYMTSTNYDLVKYPDLKITEITLQKNFNTESKDPVKFITDKYSDKKYKVIYEKE
jgi:hypothetical protein